MDMGDDANRRILKLQLAVIAFRDRVARFPAVDNELNLPKLVVIHRFGFLSGI